MTPSVDPWLRGLRIFVFWAAIAIVAGTAALVWLLFTRSPDPPAAEARRPEVMPPTAAEAPPPAPPPAQLPPEPILADLALPRGASIIDVRLDGDRIVLLLRGNDDKDYLAIVDATTGTRRALLRITAEP